MWITECKSSETGILHGEVGKKCDQPAIIKIRDWPLCFDHYNLLGKIKLKKRKDGRIIIPRGF